MKRLWAIIILIIATGLYLQTPENADPQPAPKKTPLSQQDSIIESKNQAPTAKPPTSKVQKNKVTPLQKTPKKSSLSNDFVPFDDKGNRYITQINQVGKHLVYHGDLLLGDSRDLEKFKTQKTIKQATPQKWPQAKVPFIVDESIPRFPQVMEAIDYLNLNTNISFIPRTDEKNYIHITSGNSNCYSYAGMIGGRQEIYLTTHCYTREVLHELMHSIGFLHEQNREDRDQYIQILWENILDINHMQFKKLPNTFLGVSNRPFDFNSIMMYSSYTFSLGPEEPALLTSDGHLIPNSRDFLSEEDIKRVNLAYPK